MCTLSSLTLLRIIGLEKLFGALSPKSGMDVVPSGLAFVSDRQFASDRSSSELENLCLLRASVLGGGKVHKYLSEATSS